MKIFYSENNVDYSTYTFNYAVYCIKESADEIDQIYAQGFLPYTGNINLEDEVFYMARSLRVNLENFSDTSENRRVNRLVEPLNIQLSVNSIKEIKIDDKFCKGYIEERIGEDNMSFERWEYIKNRPIANTVFEFKDDKGQLFGYVLAVMTENIVHYWFAFFNTDYMRSHSLGKYMMWAIIDWAKKNGKSYVYLGTAYKPTALYKIRDHKGLEFWDGSLWNSDVKILKEWCQTDLEEKLADRYKIITEQSVE